MSGSLFIRIAMHVTGTCAAIVEVTVVNMRSVSTRPDDRSWSLHSFISASASESSTSAPRGDFAALSIGFIAIPWQFCSGVELMRHFRRHFLAPYVSLMTETVSRPIATLRSLNWTYVLVGVSDATLLPFIPLLLLGRGLSASAIGLVLAC